MKRVLSLLLALLATLPLLTACGSKIKPEDDRVVLTLGEEEICYDYYRYVFLNSKRDMDGGDASFWENNPEAEAELKEAVMEMLLHYASIRAMAEEYDITLTKELKQSVLDDIEKTKAHYADEESYLEGMEEAFMTEYTNYYMQEQTLIWQLLYDHVTGEKNNLIPASDEILYADLPKSFRRIRYVFIEKTPKNEAEAAQKAESVLAAAKAGEDFDTLIRNHGQDPDMLRLIADGLYYTLGAIDEDVQEAVETIAEGEIAPIVEVPYGYFIVQRLPLLDAYVEKNFENLRAQYRARIFNEMLKAKAATLEKITTPLFEELTVATLK
jgi:parvulin-like peptidyl-prolyl isomerase